LLDQPLGLDPVEIREVFIEHHLTIADNEEPLLDRRRCNEPK